MQASIPPSMKKSIFQLQHQQGDTAGKIVIALERISEAFRVMLWEHAKVTGLSPIQIQLLIFLAHHAENLCNVSHLAKEFNLTKATISDAVRVLAQKELLYKITSPVDRRAFSISLTKTGKTMVKKIEHFVDPIKKQVDTLQEEDQEKLFHSLTDLIFGLNKAGILTVQRTCYSCRFYEKNKKGHYCKLMEKQLLPQDLRLDCPEFETKD